MTAAELVYFTVTGHWYDVEAPDTSGTTNAPQFLVISGFVTFTPRVPPGTTVEIANLDLGNSTSANTAVALAPITGRIYEGALSVIDQADATGIELLANSALVSASLTAQGIPSTASGLTAGTLVYDVSFTDVVYANNDQVLKNFAFTAPTTATTVDLAEPTLTRLEYNPTGY